VGKGSEFGPGKVWGKGNGEKPSQITTGTGVNMEGTSGKEKSGKIARNDCLSLPP